MLPMREYLTKKEALIAENIIDCGGKIYLVGGAVRDFIMGRKANDTDFVVRNICMKDLEGLLSNHGKVIRQKKFGIIKLYTDGICYDFALPRREKKVGTKHTDFEIEFSPSISIEDDLFRRDFTINAMAIELASNIVIDPYGGVDDIKAKTIKMVNPMAFGEDPLRILRGLRFASCLDFTIEELTLEKMNDMAPGLEDVSSERIYGEIIKTFSGANVPSKFFTLAPESVLKQIIPEIIPLKGLKQPRKFHVSDAFGHSMAALDAVEKDVMLRLIMLMHDLGKAKTMRNIQGKISFHQHEFVSAKLARNILLRWKASNETIKLVVHFIKHHMDFVSFNSDLDKEDRVVTRPWTPASHRMIRRWVGRIGRENIDSWFKMRIADMRGGKGPKTNLTKINWLREKVDEVLAYKPPFNIQDLEINGNDVMSVLGLKQGRDVGNILKKLFELVDNNEIENTRDCLLRTLQERKDLLL